MRTELGFPAPPRPETKFPLVYVEWEDHAGATGWIDMDDAIRQNSDSCLCRSIGWLIAENDHRITLVSSIGEVSEIKPKPDVAGQIVIAKGLISYMTEVAPPSIADPSP